jgi:hypothetical protein
MYTPRDLLEKEVKRLEERIEDGEGIINYHKSQTLNREIDLAEFIEEKALFVEALKKFPEPNPEPVDE